VRTWVLLRGLTRESGHWGAFLTSFQARFPRDRIVLLDLPGNGTEHRTRTPATVEAMAGWVREALLARQFKPPYHVLAMSLGAMVTTAWADQAPDEIAAAVLVNTSLKPFSRVTQRLRPRNWPRFVRLLLRPSSALAFEQAVYEMTCNTRPAPSRVLDDWVLVRRQRPVSRGNAWRQIRAALRYRAPRTCPFPLVGPDQGPMHGQAPGDAASSAPTTGRRRVLLLTSAGDQLVHADCSRQLAAAWGCAIQEHARAGHDLPFDDGPWVAEAVKRWVAALEQPVPAAPGA